MVTKVGSGNYGKQSCQQQTEMTLQCVSNNKLIYYVYKTKLCTLCTHLHLY